MCFCIRTHPENNSAPVKCGGRNMSFREGMSCGSIGMGSNNMTESLKTNGYANNKGWLMCPFQMANVLCIL